MGFSFFFITASFTAASNLQNEHLLNFPWITAYWCKVVDWRCAIHYTKAFATVAYTTIAYTTVAYASMACHPLNPLAVEGTYFQEEAVTFAIAAISTW